MKAINNNSVLEKIKSLTLQAMFADDELLEMLVLKGGNAMAMVHQISARASVDLDFSLKQDFGDNIADIEARICGSLIETFRASDYEVFDFLMIEKPRAISEDMRHFWGGYAIEFKLASTTVFTKYRDNKESLRRNAINLGQGSKFLIDISRFEYVDDKQPSTFEGYTIYVYSPMMIVCEKLRAICQQMPEYGPIIKRNRAGSARARDFVDIFVLIDTLNCDITTDKSIQILKSMFEVKKVPLSLLGKIKDVYDFHNIGFASIESTVTPGFKLQAFRFYFDYVLALIDKLKPIWDV